LGEVLISQTAYQRHLKNKEDDFEKICSRCGACCGLKNDPCSNLIEYPEKTYLCKDYENRIGMQKTVTGNSFHCVPIKELIKKGACPPLCAYGRKNI